MDEKEQLIIASVCNIITAYAAWEHDEVIDKEFESQFEGEFMSMNDAEYAEFWDIANSL